ncbi:hypothetical protein [Microbacterium sp. 3J1]|nr:hypothetical protein [Microbacterium sp. 3J1]
MSVQRSEEENAGDTVGMRAMFWIWAGLIASGLVVMILTPWAGR